MKIRKGDIALVLIITLIAGAWLLWPADVQGGSYAEVRVDNELVKQIDLTKDGLYPVQGLPGAGILEVLAGRIRMQSMPRDICPNGICCRLTGWIESTIQNIVCLPNRIVVTLVSDEELPYDLITR